LSDWYVVHSQPHAELKASEHLVRQGFETFLPRCKRWRTHARKRELVSRPLFPRYLFVSFDLERTRWRSIFSTVGVSNLICQGELPTRVPLGAVEAIRAAEEAGLFDASQTVQQLQPGSLVRVATGPFADLVGRIQSMGSPGRVRVLLGILGSEIPTNMAVSDVEPV